MDKETDMMNRFPAAARTFYSHISSSDVARVFLLALQFVVALAAGIAVMAIVFCVMKQ